MTKFLNNNDLPTQIKLSKWSKDISNQRFSRLVALYPFKRSSSGLIVWVVKCDCGNYLQVEGASLRKGNTRSCGCLQKDSVVAKNMADTEDIVNTTIGKLYIIKELGFRRRSEGVDRQTRYYLCRCECGKEIEVNRNFLITQQKTSCGCDFTFSKSEKYIETWLAEHLSKEYSFQTQYSFQDLKRIKVLRFDFAILKENKLLFLLEYNGEQHYTPFDFYRYDEIVESDAMKKDYCLKNNIRLEIIRYDENLEVRLKEIFKEA